MPRSTNGSTVDFCTETQNGNKTFIIKEIKPTTICKWINPNSFLLLRLQLKTDKINRLSSFSFLTKEHQLHSYYYYMPKMVLSVSVNIVG